MYSPILDKSVCKMTKCKIDEVVHFVIMSNYKFHFKVFCRALKYTYFYVLSNILKLKYMIVVLTVLCYYTLEGNIFKCSKLQL